MKTKQRKEITMETREVTLIRFKQNRTTIYCAECGQQTPHLSVAEAISLLSLSETEIYRLADSKQIHSKRIDGMLLLCGNLLSIKKLISEEKLYALSKRLEDL